MTTIFRLVIAIGTGPGLVLILRWFWWRINAAAELASMVAGFIIGLLTMPIADPATAQNPLVIGLAALQSRVTILQTTDFGQRLLVIASITTVIWVAAMYLTSPESPETLARFYQKVHPGGPGWNRQRIAVGEQPIRLITFAGGWPQLGFDQPGISPEQDLLLQGQQVIAAIGLLFGTMFAIGGFLLLQPLVGWLGLIIAVLGGVWLRRLQRARIAPMPRPGLEDVGDGL